MTRYLVAVAALLLTGPASAQELISGVGNAADGDTLTIGPDRVRLFGIDAPELSQTCVRGAQKWACGKEAAGRLAALVDGRVVSCKTSGIDDHQRLLGRCAANGIDLNRVMVAWGYAVAFRRYSEDYVSAEEGAKAAKRGIWAGEFQVPAEFRAAQRARTGTRTSASRRPAIARQAQRRTSVDSGTAQVRMRCDIKGNQGSNGWIYHLPGMPYYQKTRAEQMFCSEAQAQAAGYRRAIVR